MHLLAIPSRSIRWDTLDGAETKAALEEVKTQGGGPIILHCRDGMLGRSRGWSGRMVGGGGGAGTNLWLGAQGEWPSYQLRPMCVPTPTLIKTAY